MDKFRWPTQSKQIVTIAPKIKQIKFGDGYCQRIADGINNNLASYNVTIIVKREEYLWLDKFLAKQAGIHAFLWIEPNTFKEIKVICKSWTATPDNTVNTVSATFEEVVA